MMTVVTATETLSGESGCLSEVVLDQFQTKLEYGSVAARKRFGIDTGSGSKSSKLCG